MHTSQLLISLHMPVTVHCALSSVLADTSTGIQLCATLLLPSVLPLRLPQAVRAVGL